MKYCTVCKSIFDDADMIVEYVRPNNEVRGFEMVYGCPVCGSTELEDAYQCPRCYEFFPGDREICEECADDMRGHIKRIKRDLIETEGTKLAIGWLLDIWERDGFN